MTKSNPRYIFRNLNRVSLGSPLSQSDSSAIPNWAERGRLRASSSSRSLEDVAPSEPFEGTLCCNEGTSVHARVRMHREVTSPIGGPKETAEVARNIAVERGVHEPRGQKSFLLLISLLTDQSSPHSRQGSIINHDGKRRHLPPNHDGAHTQQTSPAIADPHPQPHRKPSRSLVCDTPPKAEACPPHSVGKSAWPPWYPVALARDHLNNALRFGVPC